MKPKTELEPFKNVDWDKYFESVENGPMWGTHNNMYADLVDTPKRKPEPVQPEDNSFAIALGVCGLVVAFVVVVLLIKSTGWFG